MPEDPASGRSQGKSAGRSKGRPVETLREMGACSLLRRRSELVTQRFFSHESLRDELKAPVQEARVHGVQAGFDVSVSKVVRLQKCLPSFQGR